MSEFTQRREPLSAISTNCAGVRESHVRKRQARKKTKLPVSESQNQPDQQPYVPLRPRNDHLCQPLLPWEDSSADARRIFELFWDDRVIDLLVVGTNQYAREKGAGKRLESLAGTQVPVAFGREWRKVRAKEMRVFLALLIHIGAKRGAGLSPGTFWNIKENRKSTFQAMGFKRFCQIKRYLHISDPKLQLSRSEWFEKLEPLNSIIQSRCQQYYLPASNVTVDEMMIRFGGRSNHTYRMPSKPITEGYKVFALCDVGYTYSWMFASRSNTCAGLILQEDLTPTGSTVYQLASSLPYRSGLHFNIYMDNYFPSLALLTKLRSLGIGGCGTARINAGAFPIQLHDGRKAIPWNEVSGGPVGQEGKVLGVQWQDNSAVHFLSTIHTLEERITVERKKPRISSSNGPAIRRVFGTAERSNAAIPVITNDYNRYKVGVDVADQYRSYYFTQLKCLRNWPPLFYWLVDTTVINSFLIARRLSPPFQYNNTSQAFRLLLAELLLERYGHKGQAPRKAYYKRKTTPPRYSRLQHHTSLPAPEGTPTEHEFIRQRSSGVGCTQCRFTLRGMNQKGVRATSTRFGCNGPGCGFSLCLSCYECRHKALLLSNS